MPVDFFKVLQVLFVVLFIVFAVVSSKNDLKKNINILVDKYLPNSSKGAELSYSAIRKRKVLANIYVANAKMYSPRAASNGAFPLFVDVYFERNYFLVNSMKRFNKFSYDKVKIDTLAGKRYAAVNVDEDEIRLFLKDEDFDLLRDLMQNAQGNSNL